MKNLDIILAAMISAAIWVGFWMLKPPPQPPDISIHKAAGAGNIEAVKQHLAAGADVNGPDRRGWTPLHQADVRKKRSGGWTPLHYAAYGGHKEIAELLIDNNADVSAKDQSRTTPLHYVVAGGHKKAAELLIGKGADVNTKDAAGMTPLDFSIIYNHPEIADLLRKHGGKTGEELKIEGK